MNINIRTAISNDLKTIQNLNQLLFEKEERDYNLNLNMTWAISELGAIILWI